jgi:signal transduction histidine kinase/NO-binding membrane sensor protein with MHYT domain/ActR/RegA family two-component response regulator
MFAVLSCIFGQHDLKLVAVAALICVIASSTAFRFHARGLRASGGLRWAWLGLTGLVAGSGVWATHFLAMLAYQPSLRMGYDLSETLVSLAAAVLGMGFGFSLPAWRREAGVDVVGGAITGCSVAVMHYMGIDAIRTQAHLLWDPRYVMASVLIGAAGGMAAFSVRQKVRGPWAWAPPAALLVLGIVGLHFTAMTAVTLIPDPRLAVPAQAMGRAGLAIATSGLAGFILLAGACLMLMERLGQHNTFVSLRYALNAVPAGLAFYDTGDRLRVWNDAFAAIMASCGAEPEPGHRRRRFIEASAAAGWFDQTAEGPERTVEELVARARPLGSEFRLPDGRWLRHEAFRTADGGAVTVMTDVTQLKESAVAMTAARDAAEAANRAKSEFLANMSHEIRTPLNGVLGMSDALMRTRLSPRQRELVGVIRQSGGRLDALVGDLLDLARVEAGGAKLAVKRTHLGELVAAARDRRADAAAARGLALNLAIDPAAGGWADCDAERLSHALDALIDNAVKFTEQGEVVVTAIRMDERVRFEVSDTGPGLDAEQRARLFTHFGQADGSSTRRHGGAGLGLAICSQYVRLMGGEIICHSTPGQGSVFTFTLALPARAAPKKPAAAARRKTGRKAAPKAAAAEAPGLRVLIVDDNAVNRQVLELILGAAGIEHASAEDGLAGFEAMCAGSYDAVLMDIQMPVMDGLEATRRIRAWERESGRKRAPILIVSANCLAEHVEAGRAAGADAHLNKPIAAAELLGELETQLTLAEAA